MSKNNVLTRAKKRHALACVQANRISEALDIYVKICESDPLDAESWYMAGTLFGRLGRFVEAEAALRKMVELQPKFGPAYLNLGQTLELQGKFTEAEACFRRAVEMKPDLADAHDALGRLCHQRGELSTAITHYQKAIELNPSRVSAYLSLAKTYIALGNFEAAAESIAQVLRLDVNNAGAYYDLAIIRIGQGNLEEALIHIRKALQIQPDYIQAKANEAYILELLRDYQGALDCLMPVLDRYQDCPEVALVYARLVHVTHDDAGAVDRLEKLLTMDSLSEHHRIQIHFLLGELYDKRGEYDKAFANYRQGNELSPKTINAEDWEEKFSSLMNTYNREALQRAPRAGNSSERPIFIVGMPRSGTTLVEQILSMYPDIAAAGELPDVDILDYEMHEVLNKTAPPRDITQLTREQCDSLAQRYLSMLDGKFPKAIRVTDKLPQNFLHLGLIALLFPMARIIHCVRDPLDTCLSCYFQLFSGHHPYAYDLGNLGAYYRQYQRLMRHWGEVLDIPIFELRYEDMVRDPEKLARAMVEYCGLKWDQRCLEFYKSKHFTATASSQQVIRPIYTASVGRWRHYADYLEPLKQALAGKTPMLDDDGHVVS